MTSFGQLDDANCWRVSGVRDASVFFGAIARLVRQATCVFIEGSPAPDVVALMQPYLEHTQYEAPIGTVWSWPQQNQRFVLRASPAFFTALSEAATNHANAEVCSHLHLYRDHEPLLHWFDAFDDPILVSKIIPRETLVQFCAQVGGVLSDPAA